MAMYSINKILKVKGSKIESESEFEMCISTPAPSRRRPERRQHWFFESISGVPIRQFFSDRPDWAHLGNYYFGGCWNEISRKIFTEYGEGEMIYDAEGTGHSD